MADSDNSAQIQRDEMEKVVSHLRDNVSDLQSILKSAETLGDLARDENNRPILSELGAIDALVVAFNAAFESKDCKLLAFVIRAIGNLCYENKENTIKVTSDKKIITDLVALLKSNPAECGRNIAGTLTNIAWENEDNQRRIVSEGAIGELAKFFRTDSEMSTLFMSLRAVHNLCDANEENKASINDSDVIATVFNLLKKHEDFDIQGECLGALSSFLPNDKNANKMISLSIHEYIIELITRSDDEGVQFAAAELLRELAASEEFKKISPAFAQKLLTLIHECNDEDVLGCLLRTAAWISENDSNLDLLFKNIEMFMRFCRSENIDHKISSTMLVGNLARTDDTVGAMMSNGAIDLLVELLETPDARIQQLALGAIRNMSLKEDNKQKIFAMGIMKRMTSILGSLNGNLLFSTIGLIRHFLLIGEKASEEFETSKGQDKIIMFATELAKEEHKRLLFESARVLAVNTLYTKDVSPVVNQALGSLVQLITSPWPLLHEEGTKAIAKIVESEEHRSTFLKCEGAAKGLVELLSAEQAGVVSPVLSAISFLVEREEDKKVLIEAGLVEKLSQARERTELPQELKSKIELLCMSIVD